MRKTVRHRSLAIVVATVLPWSFAGALASTTDPEAPLRTGPGQELNSAAAPDALTELPPVAVEAGALGQLLYERLAGAGLPGQPHPEAAQALRIDGVAIDTEMLRGFYESRRYRPLWTGADGALPAVRTFLDLLAVADEDLLQAADYAPDALRGRLDTRRMQSLAELELLASQSFAAYALDLRRGLIDSGFEYTAPDLAPAALSPRDVLDRAGRAWSLERFVADWRDLNPIYTALREGLARYRATAQAEYQVAIPPGPVVGAGERDRRVPLLRERLGLGAPLEASRETLYDETLAFAVERFQEAHGLERDGLLGPNTIAVLNRTVEDRIRIAELNLERARALPRDMGRRHVLVDMPAFQARLFEDDRQSGTIRVIVGEERHATPSFADRIEYIQVNPYWNVPRSILANEIAPKVLRDPSYLQRNDMQVLASWGGRTRVIDPWNVDWVAAARGGADFRVRQRPGTGNALGQIKFMFPNRHSIYLHDTPKKDLFDKGRRTFSHGCIRVEDPLRLAAFLLEGDTAGSGGAEIEALIASGRQKRIPLERTVPVYLTYFTAWPNADGTLDFRPDIYDRDPAQLQQLEERRRFMPPSPPLGPVAANAR